MRQCGLVSLQYSLGAGNSRLLWIAIEREAVGDLGALEGSCAKTKRREHLVVVVGFEDLANLVNGCCILVLRSKMMKTRW